MRTRGQSEDGGGTLESGKEHTQSLRLLLKSFICFAIFGGFDIEAKHCPLRHFTGLDNIRLSIGTNSFMC